MASAKARSTGPKSGARSTWHPPQHGVGAAKLRLAGLHHEVCGSTTTEWRTRWVTFPFSSTKRWQGWMATTPTAWHGCSSPAALASSLPSFLLLPPSSSQRPTAPGGSPHGGSGRDLAALAAKGGSAPRVAALVSPLLSLPLLLLLLSGSWWWQRIWMGSGRPARDWAFKRRPPRVCGAGGRWRSPASVPRGTRRASGERRQAQGRGRGFPPRAVRHPSVQEEEENRDERLTCGVHLVVTQGRGRW
jgi:hypothetical protein